MSISSAPSATEAAISGSSSPEAKVSAMPSGPERMRWPETTSSPQGGAGVRREVASWSDGDPHLLARRHEILLQQVRVVRFGDGDARVAQDLRQLVDVAAGPEPPGSEGRRHRARGRERPSESAPFLLSRDVVARAEKPEEMRDLSRLFALLFAFLPHLPVRQTI